MWLIGNNSTSILEDAVSIPGLSQWVKDLVLLWLWYRLAAAALIRPLACELLPGVMPWKKKKKKNLTAEVWVDVEGAGSIPGLHGGLKDLGLQQMQLRFNPWPRNFHMPWVWPLQNKMKRYAKRVKC